MMHLQILNTYKEHYHSLDKDQREDIKISIRSVFDMLPNIDLAMIVEDSNVSWTSRGSVSEHKKKLATLYKRDGKYSRYKDGSEDVDPTLFLLYNPGFIYTKKEAQKLLNDNPTTTETREIMDIKEGIGRSRIKTYKL